MTPRSGKLDEAYFTGCAWMFAAAFVVLCIAGAIGEIFFR